MKRLLRPATVALLALTFAACGGDDDHSPVTPPDEPHTPEWKLVWEDDFNQTEVNPEVWSRIPQGTPDWAVYQSLDERCYEKRESSIVLKGIVNNDKSADQRPYLCGGLWTVGKKAFAPGRIEVRARMTQARGAWPAIWMMPFKSTNGWPYDGEIDIMEHLNRDKTVYQTLHSGYIDIEGHKYNPNYSNQAIVDDIDQYHVYAVEITADKVRLFIDGLEKLNYPRMNVAGQFPFFTNWDLRIDMQLGGSWVGSIDASDLPVEMEVDWVKYYRWQ